MFCIVLIFASLFFAFPLRAADDPLSVEEIIQRNVVEPCEKLNKPRVNASCPYDKKLHQVNNLPEDQGPEAPISENLNRCDPERQDVPQTQKEQSYSGASFDVSSLSPEDAQQVFSYVKKQKSRYVLSNERAMTEVCAARSHLIAADILQDCKVASGKIFVQPSRTAITLWLGRDPLVVDTKGRKLRWDNFHVANFVNVSVNGKTEGYVIDPVLFENAVPESQWQAKLTQVNSSVNVFYTSPSAFSLSDRHTDDPRLPIDPNQAQRAIAKAKEKYRRMKDLAF